MATRVVTAALITARLESGEVVYLHRGDALPGEVTKDHVKHLTDLGFVESVGKDDAPHGATEGDGDGPKSEPDVAPKSSKK